MWTCNCVRIVSVNGLNTEFELGAPFPNVDHINNENDSVLHGPFSQFHSFSRPVSTILLGAFDFSLYILLLCCLVLCCLVQHIFLVEKKNKN